MLRKRWLGCAALLLAACSNDMATLDDEARDDLVPTGELRVAVAVGPAVSATFATRDAGTGELHGPTVRLGAALAEQLGVPVRYVPYSSSGEITTAGPRGEWDVTFVPRDPARAAVIDFGPDYSVFDSTFLVRADLDVATIADLDTSTRRIGVVDNTTTSRAAARALSHATLETFTGVDDMRDALSRGAIDAIGLSRILLTSLSANLPGTHLVDEAFHSTATAIAVPKDHSRALAYVSAFVEDAKSSGLARRVLDDTGLAAARVAPLEGD